jgi:hypothetical protein
MAYIFSFTTLVAKECLPVGMSALVVQVPAALVAVAAAVGGTGVGVAAGAQHPTKSNVTDVSPIICCSKFW